MANDEKIKSFTAYDIEKYHKGQLSAKERHLLEKAALDDPFLADALEGYLTPGVSINADLDELRRRLADKGEATRVIPMTNPGSRSFPWLRIAVIVALIAGAGWLSYRFFFRTGSDNNNIVQYSPATNKDVAVRQNKDTATGNLSSSSADEKSKEPAIVTNAGKTITKENVKSDITTENGSVSINDTRKEPVNDDSKDSPGKNSVADGYKSAVTPPSVKKEEEGNIITVQPSANNHNDFAAKKTDSIAAQQTMGAVTFGERKQALDKDRSISSSALAKPAVSDNNEKKVENEEPYRNPNFFRGRITDVHNNALPFANIINTKDNVGTYSDAKGFFTLVSPDSVMNVQVRVVGFENRKVNLQNSVTANQVIMQDDKSVAARVLDTARRNSARRSADVSMTLEEPEPADGWAYYDSYLANNLNIPETLDTRKNGSDAVEVSFEVNKNGEPVNLKIEKSLCEKCDKEAIRLIKEGPKWKRKAKKGKRTTVTVPFNKMD